MKLIFNLNRTLEYVFSDDLFMLASDPFGKRGPKLDEYLSFNTPTHQQQNNKNQNNKQQNRIRTNSSQNNNQIVNALDLNQGPSSLHDLKKETRYESYLKAAQNNNNNKYKPAIVNNHDFKKIRNVDQTSQLFEKLNEIFPNNEAEIKEILNKYPANYDIEYLTNKVLQHIQLD
jgi:tRNA U34 5-carboxymethylaminomethyl modifying enzyme MnmG/GidA